MAVLVAGTARRGEIRNRPRPFALPMIRPWMLCGRQSGVPTTWTADIADNGIEKVEVIGQQIDGMEIC